MSERRATERASYIAASIHLQFNHDCSAHVAHFVSVGVICAVLLLLLLFETNDSDIYIYILIIVLVLA